MEREIFWEPTWRSPKEPPALGDYIQVFAGCMGCGAAFYIQGVVMRIDQRGVHLHTPSPHKGIIGLRWRRAILPEFETTKQEVHTDAKS